MYQITITKTEQKKTLTKREWSRRNDKSGEDYDWTPQVEQFEDVTTEIYVQKVEVLNLFNVIKAVNSGE